MADTLTTNFETLLRQGPMTAREYMREAVSSIDDSFGDGYAEKHPELVAAFMQTAILDLQGAVIAQQIREGVEEAASAIAQGVWDGAKYVGDNR